MIAFVAPSGADREQILQQTKELLRAYGYGNNVIRLSDLLARRLAAQGLDIQSGRGRITQLQDEGNRLCTEHGADALAIAGIAEIRKARIALHSDRMDGLGGNDIVPEMAYLIWSLKRPAEVNTLRAIYRTRFFLISIHTPFDIRLDRLVSDDTGQHSETVRERLATELIERDEHEPGEFGQNVSETFAMADFFVDASNDEVLKDTLDRSVNIMFGDRFATPMRADYGMFVAHAAALKSAELGRQVGAAILSNDGDVLATGTNEIAKPSGGHYWWLDKDDDREYHNKKDTSDVMKQRLVESVVSTVAELLPGVRATDELVAAVSTGKIRDIIEFARAVHAEMGAFLDAARRGVSIKGGILYVTTFPCHLCTRMIIGAGLQRVVYIYPYPKSLADDLFSRQIITGRPVRREPREGAIPFVSFIGVAPRRYPLAFVAPMHRKRATGEVIRNEERSPRLLMEDETGRWDFSTHLVREFQLLGDSEYQWLGTAFESGTAGGEGGTGSARADG